MSSKTQTPRMALDRRRFGSLAGATALSAGVGNGAVASTRRVPHSVFLVGVSSSALETEGAIFADGKGQSLEDHEVLATRDPVRIRRADEAVGFYHRYREDIQLMALANLNAFRFSMMWTRLFPEVSGPVNAKARAHYDRVLDSMLEASLVPVLTVNHFDMPYKLYQRGGWLNRDMAYRVAEYAYRLAVLYGDRVPYMIMVNEPNFEVIDSFFAIRELREPEGPDFEGLLTKMHHLNLAGGLAVDAVHAGSAATKAAVHLQIVEFVGYTDSEADHHQAAQLDAIFNRAYLDPPFRGRYPEPVRGWFDRRSIIKPGDLGIIHKPSMDYFSFNYYFKVWVTPDGTLTGDYSKIPPGTPLNMDRTPFSPQGTPTVPGALYDILIRLRDQYGNPPVLIGENGVATLDPFPSRQRRHDVYRVDYIRDHLKAVVHARENGCRVFGYCYWSGTDTFEFSMFRKWRFGLVDVEYNNDLRRVPRLSWHWLRWLLRDEHWRRRLDQPCPRDLMLAVE